MPVSGWYSSDLGSGRLSRTKSRAGPTSDQRWLVISVSQGDTYLLRSLFAGGAPAPRHRGPPPLAAASGGAHGGGFPDGDKDTISRLQRRLDVMHLPVHPQRLAAVLRLADEFSENPRRADEGALREDGGAPPQSVVHNLYCKTVNISFDYVGHTIGVEYEVPTSVLSRRFRTSADPASDVLLVDYIRGRLEKSELERRYCNRFLAGLVTYDRISVRLDITEAGDSVDELGFYLEDRGYPTAGLNWPAIASRLDGASRRDRLSPPPARDEQP